MDMTHKIDTAERKLKRVKINLLRDDRFVFWRGVMMVGTTELVDTIPTACTDGRNELYGRAFVESQNEKQLAFGVLHENLHKISRDLTIWAKLFAEDAQCANMACDYRHNLLLVDMDPLEQTIQFPTNPDGSRMGLLDERFRGMDVPTIYRLLRQEKQSGTGAFGPNGDGTNCKDNFDNHDVSGANARDGEVKDTHEKEIDQALRQGEMERRKLHGDKGGELSRELSELLQPKINWREVLADFVRSISAGKDKSSWRRPNRRFMSMDVLMPSLISERVGHVVVGVDTSGSISGREINVMLTEVCQVASQVRPDKIDLLYWDARVASHEEYTEGNFDMMATSTKPMGGGGTDPACVKRYLDEKHIMPECIIMLTDGYVGSWPTFDCPVLWIITTKGITAPNGVSIYLEDN